MLSRLPLKPMAVAAVAIVVAALFFGLLPRDNGRTLTAHFTRTVSLYVGNEVRILGVPVGEVTSVVPEGNSVRVEMTYDEEYDVPANAQAVIVNPTLVADRFVQLTPAINEGEEPMPDGGEIPLDRTAVPVELDRVYGSLDELSKALGPNGVNANGSLDTLLAAGTKTLEGKGAEGNAMIRDMSAAVGTFGEGSGELFTTVRQLQLFVDALAQNDRFVRSFIQDMAAVSGQLSGEREELQAALVNLADAVGKVDRFVRTNKKAVQSDVEALGDVTGTIVKEKDSLATALEKGPVGAGNLALGFDNTSHAIGARIQMGPSIDGIDDFLCSVVQNSDIPSKKQACTLFNRIFDRLPSADPELNQQPEIKPLTGKVSQDYPRQRRNVTLADLLGGAS